MTEMTEKEERAAFIKRFEELEENGWEYQPYFRLYWEDYCTEFEAFVKGNEYHKITYNPNKIHPVRKWEPMGQNR